MNSSANRVTIEEDMVFQRREWLVQRISWVLAGVVLVLALLGVFGTGPLSWTSTTTPDGLLHLEYERFARQLGMTALAVDIAPEAARQGEIRLQISQDYLGDVMVQKVTPEPLAVVNGAGKLTYVFTTDEVTEPLKVSFDLRPDRVGVQHAEVGIEGAPPTRFRQFVYP